MWSGSEQISDKSVQCDRCKTNALVTVENGRPVTVTCPKCGESESYEKFMESVGAQMFELADEMISKPLKEWAKRDKNVTYEPSRRPRRSSGKFRVNL